MEILYIKALQHINYTFDNENTIDKQVRMAFEDFYVSGQFDNLEPEDLEDISTKDMAKALLRS